ncbi:TIGR02281 family clan AA aspartic protease [Moritella sp. Urea-trap-13]|uniref:retropepsin-like aspartic protease family protein n=1 Tax=Moritella sp. Urea-trap-13 TaxID=2058327 RepID=UPI000C335125|nr:retropepsin-like aspartic protease [Moritella sp. Urea-trap-13]PKH05079.1 TIGR02281 family clan AA aspartic protease [Moritella sp. Urea-trap-13]
MDGNQKIAKAMTYIAWISGLIVMTLFFNSYLSNQQNPNSDPESYQQNGNAVVMLQQNRAGHYVTNGYINGYQVKFLLDTGATQVSIPAKVAEQIGLDAGYSQSVNTANGVIEVFSTHLDSLSVGELTLYDLSANINPYMQGDTILLGMNALKQVKLVQQGKTLTLSEY